MPLVLIAGLLVAEAAGCATARDKVEYIPADRAVAPLKKGDPAPADGWFVPPAIMQEIVPCLDDRFRSGREPKAESQGPDKANGPSPRQ